MTKSWDTIKQERTAREYAEITRYDEIMKTKSVELGVIESTTLGTEDHGIMSSFINLNFGAG